eukprot:Anaeramoba_ignava/a226265_26.p1 GENE.a226265_26~~a226265_26.p1  ORF type:complete len:194 (-),score=106.57 a226265_26:13-594(-)
METRQKRKLKLQQQENEVIESSQLEEAKRSKPTTPIKNKATPIKNKTTPIKNKTKIKAKSATPKKSKIKIPKKTKSSTKQKKSKIKKHKKDEDVFLNPTDFSIQKDGSIKLASKQTKTITWVIEELNECSINELSQFIRKYQLENQFATQSKELEKQQMRKTFIEYYQKKKEERLKEKQERKKIKQETKKEKK